MKKKWFWIILILAIVAVILTIVFINLFREKDTKQLSEKVNTAVTSGYLSESSQEYLLINQYFDDVYSKLTTSEEKCEVKNYQDSYKAHVIAGKFFNSELLFASYSETYKNNRKKIEDNLKNAQEAATKMKDYLVENKDVVGGSGYWQANTWANCKADARDMFQKTSDAFDLLGNVYQNSVPSKIMCNDLTKLIFDTMKEFSAETKEKFNTDQDCGQKLYNFVNIYLTESGVRMILNFNYSAVAQAKVENIKTNGKTCPDYQDFLAGRVEG